MSRLDVSSHVLLPGHLAQCRKERCIVIISCYSLYITAYMYAFSRRFYPKRLTIAFRLYIFNQYVCSLGIEPTTFCAANAMLYH